MAESPDTTIVKQTLKGVTHRVFYYYYYYYYYLLQLVFSACVAAVKSRPVLHHCVVIFFWSSGNMECTCILFTFANGVLLMR